MSGPQQPTVPATTTTTPAAGGQEPPVLAHLSVIQTIYHQVHGSQPNLVEIRYSHNLKTDESPYQRQVSVGGDWIPLDHGWISRASQVVIHNLEGRFLRTQPTPQERAASEAKVLEIAFADPATAATPNQTPAILVFPREAAAFAPVDVTGIKIRSRSGPAKFTVTVLPE